MKICQARYHDDLSLFFNIQGVDLNKLDSEGRLPGESTDNVLLNENASHGYPTNYANGN